MTDKDYIKMLKERDKAMPMGRYYFKSEGLKDRPPIDACGACGEPLVGGANFCDKCGQRADRTLYKL